MTAMHLAEVNVGRLLAPTDDPRVAEFMDNLDRINGLGKRMPGFVWIMEGSGAPGTGNTDAKIDGDPLYVANLTVWKDFASLDNFVHATLHARFMARGAEWFEVAGARQFAMWWVPVGDQPTLEEALERLAHLRNNGDSDYAFGWDWARALEKQAIKGTS